MGCSLVYTFLYIVDGGLDSVDRYCCALSFNDQTVKSLACRVLEICFGTVAVLSLKYTKKSLNEKTPCSTPSLIIIRLLRNPSCFTLSFSQLYKCFPSDGHPQ